MMEGGPGSKAKDQSTIKGDTLESPAHYGLHRHFTQGSSVLMFGGGVKKGHVHGATADERPLVAIKDPVSISDLHATIFTAMGISRKPFSKSSNARSTPPRTAREWQCSRSSHEI